MTNVIVFVGQNVYWFSIYVAINSIIDEEIKRGEYKIEETENVQ